MTAPWTNAVWFGFDSLHGPSAGLVAVSWYGVASPCAVSGLAGTISVQFGFGVAAAALLLALRRCPVPTAAAATTATLATPATMARVGTFALDRRRLLEYPA